MEDGRGSLIALRAVRHAGPHRDAQRRSGRQAAGDAIAVLHPGTIAQITEGALGQPVSKEARISISHGREFSIAVASLGGHVGIDFCEWDRAPLIRKLSPRFFPRELASHAQRWNDRDWVRAWAAKEAGLKTLGWGLASGGVLDGSDEAGLTIRGFARGRARLARADLVIQAYDSVGGVIALALERRPSKYICRKYLADLLAGVAIGPS